MNSFMCQSYTEKSQINTYVCLPIYRDERWLDMRLTGLCSLSILYTVLFDNSHPKGRSESKWLALCKKWIF